MLHNTYWKIEGDIDKRAKDQDIINKINLIGDIHTYAKALGRASLFVLSLYAKFSMFEIYQT
jgi:hypothetical protein